MYSEITFSSKILASIHSNLYVIAVMWKERKKSEIPLNSFLFKNRFYKNGQLHAHL